MTSIGPESKLEITELCEIIREPQFDEAMQEISKGYERLQELDDAIDWALKRGPLNFHLVEDNYYIWKTDNIVPGFPALRIVYQYDESSKTVTLVAVEEVENETVNE